MTVRALVIEDDPHIQDVVTDIVESLGHQLDVVGCQDEARQKLATNEYDYFLLDLEIPVKPDRSVARLQNGLNLLGELVSLFGRQNPVIVMTAHGNDGPNQGVECLKNGAADYVPKPFPRTGKTLDSAILDALARAGRAPSAPGRSSSKPQLRQFEGGQVRLLKKRLIICDVEVPISAMMHAILSVLNTKHGNGKYVAFAGSEIAEHPDVDCKRGQNGVSEAVHKLRKRIATKLLEEANVEVDDHDIIRSKGEGYRINEGVKMKVGVRKQNLVLAGNVTDGTEKWPIGTNDGTVNVTVEDLDVTDLNERQVWIMAMVDRGTEVRVSMVVEHFRCSVRTAKRDLGELKDKDLIRFVGSPRNGYYRLV